MTAYSIGLGIPFLIASFGVDWVTTVLRKYGRVLDITYKGMGVVLILLGILLRCWAVAVCGEGMRNKIAADGVRWKRRAVC